MVPKSLSSGTKVALSVAQLITLVASVLGGGGSVGFILGNLIPRLEQVESRTTDVQVLQTKLALTLERLAAIVEMDHDALNNMRADNPTRTVPP
jgi:hypothetical protein